MTNRVRGASYPQMQLDADGGWLPANRAYLALRAAKARRATNRVNELAQRQAALRRVATLVARGVSPSEVFTAVALEVAKALRVGSCVLVRYLEECRYSSGSGRAHRG
jgi:pilus assembly protein TadC